jgi:hypothetical protein
MNGSKSQNEKAMQSLDRNLTGWDEAYREQMRQANNRFVARLLMAMPA